MKVRLFITIFILFSIISSALFSQAQLSVDINDPVYSILEVSEIRGLINRLTKVKPYNINKVENDLNVLIKKNYVSSKEKELLNFYYKKYTIKHSNLNIGLSEYSEMRLDAASLDNFHSLNRILPEVTGGIGKDFAYNINLGIYLDKIDRDAFAPYTFTKRWDGFHIWFGPGKYSNGENNHLNFTFSTLPELSLDLLGGRVNLKYARIRRNWGIGDGSLSLSKTARPIDSIEGSAKLAPWVYISFLTGSLGDWRDPVHEQKMLSIHRVELFPFNWLYLSAWESVIWAKRLEFSYLNPVMIYYLSQNTNGDLDNIALGGDIGITISPYFRYYFSFYIDELENDVWGKFFQYPKNQYAWQTGVKVPLPWLPFSLLTLQYTKIEPYCYTHYMQNYPNYKEPVNINYTNDGENIGYHLPPNSDEFLLKYSAFPLNRLYSEVLYQLIRHGTGKHENGQIEGDIDIPLNYGNLKAYPDKDFLHDGIYEWINIFSLKLKYRVLAPGFNIWAEYSYVNAVNYANITGNSVTKHIFGMGINWNILNF